MLLPHCLKILAERLYALTELTFVKPLDVGLKKCDCVAALERPRQSLLCGINCLQGLSLKFVRITVILRIFLLSVRTCAWRLQQRSCLYLCFY